MSDSDANNQQNEQYGGDPESGMQVPPYYYGYYGYPPHMMQPWMFPQMHPGMQPQMHPGMQPQMHPGMQPQMHPGMQPQMHPGMQPQMYSGMNPEMPEQENSTPENNPLFDQAQSMLDEALGEEAGMFKEILGAMGMNDKEFWKGAMIGAAAALLLSNDKVRGKLMSGLSGAGDMLKSSGSSLKETAANTASSVKENVSTGSEIFKDTYSAGKDGFKESVERHQSKPEASSFENEELEPKAE